MFWKTNCKCDDKWNFWFKKRKNFVNVSQTKQKKSIKTRNSIVAKNLINISNNNQFIHELLNLKTKINFIKQSYVIQHELSTLNVVLSRSKFLNDKTQYCYDVHELKYHLIDFWKQHREMIIVFYAVNFEKFDVILNISMLIDNFIILNSTTTSWRFNVNNFKLTIEKSKNFAKSFQKKSILFVLICANVDESTQNNIQILKVSKQVKNFKSTFDDKMTEILIDDKNAHHAIDLIKNKKSSFMLLYNLFQKKTDKIATLYWKCFNKKMN